MSDEPQWLKEHFAEIKEIDERLGRTFANKRLRVTFRDANGDPIPGVGDGYDRKYRGLDGDEPDGTIEKDLVSTPYQKYEIRGFEDLHDEIGSFAVGMAYKCENASISIEVFDTDEMLGL